MEQQLSDESLAASAQSAAYKNMCKSFVIATGVPPTRPPGRNYYHCDQGTQKHENHYNGASRWFLNADGTWVIEGNTLTNVNFQGANP